MRKSRLVRTRLLGSGINLQVIHQLIPQGGEASCNRSVEQPQFCFPALLFTLQRSNRQIKKTQRVHQAACNAHQRNVDGVAGAQERVIFGNGQAFIDPRASMIRSLRVRAT